MTFKNSGIVTLERSGLNQHEERISGLKSSFYAELEEKFQQSKALGGADYIRDTFLLLIDEVSRLKAEVLLCRDQIAERSSAAPTEMPSVANRALLPADGSAPTHFIYTAPQTPPGPGLGGHETDEIGDFRWIIGDALWIFSARVNYQRRLRIEIAVRPLTHDISVRDFSLSINGISTNLRHDRTTNRLIAEFSDAKPHHGSDIQMMMIPRKYYEVEGDPRRFSARISRVDIISDLDGAYANQGASDD